MEYTQEAMERVAYLVKTYRDDLLRYAMDNAAEEGAKEIRPDHIESAYNRLWD